MARLKTYLLAVATVLMALAIGYFGPPSGIGLAFDSLRNAPPLRVGIVGLGVGTLASYGRAGDDYRFYELDPGMIRVAQDQGYFDYLRRSAAQISVEAGDGRLRLATETDRFDVLVLDAFSSDSVPVHLLTREAFELYRSSLAPGGLLAMNVSNRHFDLMPLVMSQARVAGLHALGVINAPAPELFSSPARWVLMAAEERQLEELRSFIERRRKELGLADPDIELRVLQEDEIDVAPVWTDNYSDLFSVLAPARLNLRFNIDLSNW